jgi:hypothetical protein
MEMLSPKGSTLGFAQQIQRPSFRVPLAGVWPKGKGGFSFLQVLSVFFSFPSAVGVRPKRLQRLPLVGVCLKVKGGSVSFSFLQVLSVSFNFLQFLSVSLRFFQILSVSFSFFHFLSVYCRLFQFPSGFQAPKARAPLRVFSQRAKEGSVSFSFFQVSSVLFSSLHVHSAPFTFIHFLSRSFSFL